MYPSDLNFVEGMGLTGHNYLMVGAEKKKPKKKNKNNFPMLTNSFFAYLFIYFLHFTKKMLCIEKDNWKREVAKF